MAVTAVVAEETSNFSFQKGLSEWWNEETEYVFQRIERWAAFARGYNRLRSERLSRGRMTMQEEQEPHWTISANKLVIDDNSWSPRFHALKRSRVRRSQPEDTKINCCGTFNYKSNSNLDSNCLETYSYDHSIYFKTIGDIRSSRRNLNKEESKENHRTDENIEWERVEYSAWRLEDEALSEENEIDFNRLSIDKSENINYDDKNKADESEEADEKEENNNNYEQIETDSVYIKENENAYIQFFEGILLNDENRQSDNMEYKNVSWPNTFLHYTQNTDNTIHEIHRHTIYEC